MALESVTHISDLNASNPVDTVDPGADLGDHIRNLKTALLTDFPAITGAVTSSHTELNLLDGFVGAISSTTDTQTLTNKTLTSPVINSPTLSLAQSASPTPTAEGVVEWDTDDNALKVGDGASTQTFSPDSKAGRIVQIVNVQDGALATGSTVFPIDDTIPQITEGVEFMTLAITPTSATNKLKIDVVCNLAHSSTVGLLAGALFQDATAGALAAGIEGRNGAADNSGTVSFTHYMTAGTASATTFRVRAGSSSAGTTTFNGATSARLFGGVMASSITITEIQA